MKSLEPAWVNEKQFTCKCGAVLATRVKTDLLYDEHHCSDGDFLNSSQELDCEVCGLEYQVSVEATVVVNIIDTFIEVVGQKKIRNPLNSDLPEETLEMLSELLVGDSIDLQDGAYIVMPYEFIIESGILTNKYSAVVDQNQTSLELVEEEPGKEELTLV